MFCGSCNIISKIDKNRVRIANDKHKYLIAMWKELQNGWDMPNNISEEEYKYIKNHKDENPALTGFVGFGLSYSGKWFGGYGKSKKPNGEIRWHSDETKRALERDMKHLQSVRFTCLDYREVDIPNGSIVYADPPYANTTTYQGQKFDSEAFWEYMRQISKNNQVFISEQTAPDDFECIWEKPFTRTLDRNKDNQFKVVEKLFTYKK